MFEAFQFFVKQTEWGTMQIHGYPFSDKGSTFIVEMHEDVWRSAGLDKTEHDDFPPGVSDEFAVERVAEIFAAELGGHEILTNNSKWMNFHTVRNERWSYDNVVLLGDAAHTAHFSIGSGTKLAMEDALALAACLHENPTVEAALTAYEIERKPVVESTQRAAQASLEWFENIGMYADQEPAQFVFNLLTRSRRITFANLKDRDHEFADRMESEFARHVGADEVAPAMFQPVSIGALRLKNRIVVSPMDMYSRDRRTGQRVPPGAPRQQGSWWGGSGDDGDGVRLPRGPDHPRLHWPVDRRAARRLCPGYRLRARPLQRQDRPATGPLGAQGLDAS